MNQILSFKNIEEENDINNATTLNHNVNKQKNKFNLFLKIQFVFSNIVTIIFIYYFLTYKLTINKQEKLSKELLRDFNISSLYSSTNDYSSKKIYYNYNSTSSFSIIGLIEIPKLNIIYPIISEISDDFLKIAPCKFYGPDFNQLRQYLYSRT